MNQAKEYKEGAILGAIAATISFGLGLYMTIKNFDNYNDFTKFIQISVLACMLCTAIFAFIKLEKLSAIFLAGTFIFSSIFFIKYLKHYNDYLEVGFDSGKYNFKVHETLYYLTAGFDPYVVMAEALFTFILFIMVFTVPNRKGLVTTVTIFAVLGGIIVVTNTVCYIVGMAEYADRIKNFWLDVIIEMVKGITDMLMAIGIAKSVTRDEVKMAGGYNNGPQGGMYVIPFSNASVNNAPYQMKSFNQPNMNYNQPQNMGYGQMNSGNLNRFQPQNGFGQPGNMSGFGQQGGYGQMNNNFNQPGNMGGYGAMGGFGQQNMGGYISNQPMNSGSYPAQQMNNFGQPNMGYGQMNNSNMNRFQPQQPQNMGAPMGQEAPKPEAPSAQPKPDMTASSLDVSSQPKPDVAPSQESSSAPTQPEKTDSPVEAPSAPSDDINASAARDLSLYEKPDNV